MFRRIGAFFYAFLPFLLVYMFQMIASAYMSILGAISSMLRASSGCGWESLYQQILSDPDFSNLIMIVYSLLSIVIFGIWYYTQCHGTFGPKAVREFRPALFAGIVLMIPGLQFLSSLICLTIALVSPSALESYNELLTDAGVMDATALLLLYSVILAPLCEELVFRGVTLRLFRRSVRGFWLANLLQALLFGIYHGNFIQGAYAFCFGLFLGWFCECGGTIYYSMFAHILYNFWGMILSSILDSLNLPDLLYLLMEAVMLLLLIAGLLVFARGLKRKRAE